MTYEAYRETIDLLNRYAYHYYVLDNPIATDEEYDRLYRAAEAYEKAHPDKVRPDSPTQRVGDRPLDAFENEKHLSRMWSLEDIFDEDELRKWIERVEKGLDGQTVHYYCEP